MWSVCLYLVQYVLCVYAAYPIVHDEQSSLLYPFPSLPFTPPSVQVVVSEAAPRYSGHLMARSLSQSGVPTTLIADSAVFALMARANKVRGRTLFYNNNVCSSQLHGGRRQQERLEV